MKVDKRLKKNKNIDQKKIIVDFLYDDRDIEFIKEMISIVEKIDKRDSISICNRLRDYNYYVRDCDNKGIKNMINEIDTFISRYGNFVY